MKEKTTRKERTIGHGIRVILLIRRERGVHRLPVRSRLLFSFFSCERPSFPEQKSDSLQIETRTTSLRKEAQKRKKLAAAAGSAAKKIPIRTLFEIPAWWNVAKLALDFREVSFAVLEACVFLIIAKEVAKRRCLLLLRKLVSKT